MLRTSLAVMISAFSLAACAADAPAPAAVGAGTALGGSSAAASGLSSAQEQRVRQALEGLVPNVSVDRIRPTPIQGMYEVVVSGQVLYISQDARYLVQGSLFEIESRTDLTEQAKASVRVPLLESVGPEGRIIFGDDDATHRITVFTDIDCGYCRRMHEEVAQYNALGIAVEYLFYPRGGPNTEAWNKSVSVWCADDRHAAMTAAKAGRQVPEATCENPVQSDFELGRQVGVEGTPAVYNENGVQLGGYLPPQQMLQRLETLKAQGGS